MTIFFFICGVLAWMFATDKYGAFKERRRVVAYLRRVANNPILTSYRESGGNQVAALADLIARNAHRGQDTRTPPAEQAATFAANAYAAKLAAESDPTRPHDPSDCTVCAKGEAHAAIEPPAVHPPTSPVDLEE